jgi:hypothetical protein
MEYSPVDLQKRLAPVTHSVRQMADIAEYRRHHSALCLIIASNNGIQYIKPYAYGTNCALGTRQNRKPVMYQSIVLNEVQRLGTLLAFVNPMSFYSLRFKGLSKKTIKPLSAGQFSIVRI